MPTACYLDIETTGLSPRHSVASVVGLRAGDGVFQWHGDQEALARLLAYNREDVETLPLLHHKLQERSRRVSRVFKLAQDGASIKKMLERL